MGIAFREKFSIYRMPSEGYILLADNESHFLEGKILDHVIPLIDGTRSTDEICASLSGAYRDDDIHAALSYLKECGHVHEPKATEARAGELFWETFGQDAGQIKDALKQRPVEIHSIGRTRLDDIAPWFQTLDIEISGRSELAFVLCDDYLDPRLEALNRAFTARGMPWMIARAAPPSPLLGPLFVPGQTACWSCLAYRLRENRDVEQLIAQRLGLAGIPARPIPHSDLFQAHVLSAAAAQILRYLLTGTTSGLDGRIKVVDLFAGQQTFHDVMTRPQCPDCGNPALGRIGGAPRSLRTGVDAASTENGERARSPEATLERYGPHVSPLTGVIKGITPSEYNETTPLRSYMSDVNIAGLDHGVRGLQRNLRSMAAGKGRSDIQARTSALCEGLERYSAKFRGDEEIRIRARLSDLKGAAIHPNDCMLYSDTQYAERQMWNARGSMFQFVPAPFDPEAACDWTPVWSLSGDTVRYLPTAYLFYGYNDPAVGEITVWADSNGCAAGSTLEDACLQGLCELVERDAVALWWYSRQCRPGVDLSGLDPEYMDELAAYFGELNREFWLLDLTNDLDVPAFVAVSRRMGAPTEDIVMGFGAHLDHRVAALRAITEMNQFMPAVLRVDPATGTTQYSINDPESLNWWQNATVENQPYLRPDPNLPKTTLTGGRAGPNASIDESLGAVVQRIERLGHEVLMLDQTRADVGLPVVKIIAPGLRHFWARLAPGRLYTAPVDLGWRATPLRENELNPIAMFL